MSALVSLLIALPVMAQPVAPENVLDISLIVPLSGPLEPVGRSVRDGATDLVDWVNANGGIAGRPIRLLTADDRGDPARAMKRAFEQIERHDPLAFLAPVGCASTQALLPLAQRLSIPVIGPMCGDRSLRRPVVREAFTIGAGHDEQAAALFARMLALGKRRFALIAQNDAFGDSVRRPLSDAAAVAHSGKVTLDDIAFGSSDIASLVRRTLAGEPEVVMLARAGEGITALVDALRAAGFDGMLIAIAEDHPAVLAQRLSGQTDKLEIARPNSPDMSGSIAARACQVLIDRVTEPGPRAARLHGCLAAQILIAGLRRGGDSLDEPAALIAALERPSHRLATGATDPLAFSAFDHQAFDSPAVVGHARLPFPASLASARP
ncbi:MAG: ABC transporter substrate-binding protein [Burkholderiaceae bacterium]